MNLNNKSSRLSLLVFLLIVFTIEFFGHYFTALSVKTWFPTLLKPTWNPPAWVFGPVWTLLYFLIALSGWLIFEERGKAGRIKALSFYFFQLFLNFIWSFLFFGLKNPFLGLVDILLLLIVISATIGSFWKINRLAAYLLLPYFFWTIYAAVLNYKIWVLNS